MKKLLVCWIGLICFLAVAGSWLLRQPENQRKIALSCLPANSSIAAIDIDGGTIVCQDLKIPLERDGWIEIKAARAQYAIWESIKNRQLQLYNCHIDGLKIDVCTKVSTRALTESHSPPALEQTVWQMPKLTIPPLSIQRLQLVGSLHLQDQLDSQFRLEAKNIGPDQVCELSLTAKTEFETSQSFAIDQITTELRSKFEITREGHIRLQNSDLDARSQDLNARITIQDSADSENYLRWQASLNYAAATAQELKLAGTAVTIHNAELNLNGSVQHGLATVIDQAELQLMTAPFGNIQIRSRQKIQIRSRQKIHYPQFTNTNGELCSIRMPHLALSAFKHYLPPGYTVESNAAASHFILHKEADQYTLRSEQIIDWRGIELMGPAGPLACGIDALQMSPEIRFRPPETFVVKIPDLSISQKSKPLLKTSILAKGSINQLAASSVEAQFSVATDGIAQASELHASGTFQYQPNHEWPLNLVTQLIPKEQNLGDSLELRVQSQLAPQEYLPIKLQAFIGQAPNLTSDLQLDARLNLKGKPLQLSAQIDSSRSQWSDLRRWIERFQPSKNLQIPPRAKTPASSKQTAAATPSSEAAWGAIDAHVTAQIENIEISPQHRIATLNFESVITPQFLEIQNFKAQLADASIQATGRCDYSPSAKPYYRNQLDLSFKNFKAHNFIPNQKSWKIDGTFEGALQINGQADDCLQAWKNSLGRLSVHSYNGRLELLELSRRKSLGIAGAELLGFGLSALLDQPEIHTKTRAGIALLPYFRQIDYQAIELECVRETLELIDISKLQLLSSELRIQGFGAIGAQPIQYLLQQPLRCQLSFASKGPIIESLEVLDLIEGPPDADNFFDWKPRFEISGSLNHLNTDAFSDFFQQEARNLLRSPPQRTVNDEPTRNLTDGIDLLEKIFSQ